MVNDNLAISTNYDQNTLFDEAELNWCQVSLSDIISRGVRLEASVYGIDGRKARASVENCRFEKKTLTGKNGIAVAYTCPRFKRNWVEKSEFPIYQPSSILELYPKPDGYIAKNTGTNIESLRVQNNQVLITCSGTIGKVTLVSKTLGKKIFSHDLLRVTCNNEDDAGYLYCYIKSDVGNKLLTTNHYGAVVSHIEASHLNEIPIPYPDMPIRKNISNLISKSFFLRDRANEYWEKSLSVLYSALHLADISKFKSENINSALNSFTVKLSKLNGRLDASFHDCFGDIILKQIKKYASITTLGDSQLSEEIFLPERYRRVYVSKGHGTKMFGIKQITTLDPFTEKYLALGCINSSLRKKLLLKPGMILISRSGTIGNMCIVPPHWKGWIASEDLIRIKAKSEYEGYVYCFLFSDYGQELIKRFSFGSVQDHIDCDQVSNFPVPILYDVEKMEEINQLVMKCNNLRAESYQVEQEAIKVFNNNVIKSEMR